MRSDAEFFVSEADVRTALQHSKIETTNLAIEDMTSGWDNYMFRLGEEYIFRTPKREIAIGLLRNELRTLPVIAPQVKLAVPRQLDAGIINGRPWVLQSYIKGEPVGHTQFEDSIVAHDWAYFLKRLHGLEIPNLPSNPYRGVPLLQREADFLEYVSMFKPKHAHLKEKALSTWSDLIQIAIDTDSVTIHGDLHPWNVLKKSGYICGVIDWGDMTFGDPATDLASCYYYFQKKELQTAFFEHYGASEPTIERARGWATYILSALLSHAPTEDDARSFALKLKSVLSITGP